MHLSTFCSTQQLDICPTWWNKQLQPVFPPKVLLNVMTLKHIPITAASRNIRENKKCVTASEKHPAAYCPGQQQKRLYRSTMDLGGWILQTGAGNVWGESKASCWCRNWSSWRWIKRWFHLLQLGGSDWSEARLTGRKKGCNQFKELQLEEDILKQMSGTC